MFHFYGREGNFVKLDWYAIQNLNEVYDYSSILHYSRFAFSKDKTTKPTLEPKNKRARIGQRKRLSEGDVRKINKLYILTAADNQLESWYSIHLVTEISAHCIKFNMVGINKLSLPESSIRYGYKL
ncbi:UNVERIFIED_CONTAM: Bmp1 [Trichonephila clavipes]